MNPGLNKRRTTSSRALPAVLRLSQLMGRRLRTVTRLERIGAHALRHFSPLAATERSGPFPHPEAARSRISQLHPGLRLGRSGFCGERPPEDLGFLGGEIRRVVHMTNVCSTDQELISATSALIGTALGSSGCRRGRRLVSPLGPCRLRRCHQRAEHLEHVWKSPSHRRVDLRELRVHPSPQRRAGARLRLIPTGRHGPCRCAPWPVVGTSRSRVRPDA